ncbi:hypothetical protein [Microbacterium candidum]|uniref:Uncharacterized protein n=1 Tax=Microbacterium candidum TaxID=3041922 RepID=A0ABT7N3D5_9MICO|nr:hypothetical protein [Microbacterium sp. ASV49]MDL9981191.1 hypothetical protein [Microbacterium sp. ASV49]
MDEEGYAGLYFRDVRVITGTPVADARGVMLWEQKAAAWVANHSANEAEFEELAKAAEGIDADGEIEDLEALADLPATLAEDQHCLWGLDLGVSGLSHVLSALGFYPVASCRSHLAHSWSPEPVVLFASDEDRLRLLQPFIAESGCGLGLDSSRGHTLVVVYAPSIVEMLALTASIFDARASFRSLPKTARKQSQPDEVVVAAPEEGRPTLF